MKPIIKSFTIIVVSLFVFYSGTNAQENIKRGYNKKIIKFNHAFHIEMEVDCITCHSSVEESMSLNDSLLPTMENCSTCHDVEDDEECGQCHYEDVFEPLETDQTLLKFNHTYHLEMEGLECVDCHKGLDKAEYSFESTELIPTMNTCTSCHGFEKKATIECSTCHLKPNDLLPVSHAKTDFLRTHKFETSNTDCASCHENSFCEDCHIATNKIDESNLKNDFYTPYKTYDGNNTKLQTITRVHDLNFRFTHGVEARTKSFECQTCHQTETFCAECHSSAEEDFAIGGIRPLSHIVPNFTTIGFGSGGGEHAVLARRDIEICASCHDTEGSDPACILCHVDPDGQKETNPKTHISSFMSSSEDGDWHSSMGSICFNCHIDANARPTGIPGQGFCGYCHGSK